MRSGTPWLSPLREGLHLGEEAADSWLSACTKAAAPQGDAEAAWGLPPCEAWLPQWTPAEEPATDPGPIKVPLCVPKEAALHAGLSPHLPKQEPCR